MVTLTELATLETARLLRGEVGVSAVNPLAWDDAVELPRFAAFWVELATLRVEVALCAARALGSADGCPPTP